MEVKSMGVNKMVGTPWHHEVLHKHENDERRHKSRCRNYSTGYCKCLNHRCIGSAHCQYYKEKMN